MFKSKQLVYLIASLGVTLFFLALASRTMHAETVTLRLSPSGGLEFKAEGSQP
jgi:hypothetical protein